MFGDIDKVNEQIAARKLKEYNQNCSDQRDYSDEWDLNYIHFFSWKILNVSWLQFLTFINYLQQCLTCNLLEICSPSTLHQHFAFIKIHQFAFTKIKTKAWTRMFSEVDTTRKKEKLFNQLFCINNIDHINKLHRKNGTMKQKGIKATKEEEY